MFLFGMSWFLTVLLVVYLLTRPDPQRVSSFRVHFHFPLLGAAWPSAETIVLGSKMLNARSPFQCVPQVLSILAWRPQCAFLFQKVILLVRNTLVSSLWSQDDFICIAQAENLPNWLWWRDLQFKAASRWAFVEYRSWLINGDKNAQMRSKPSPSDIPQSGLSRGLYRSWQDHSCTYAWKTLVPNLRRFNARSSANWSRYGGDKASVRLDALHLNYKSWYAHTYYSFLNIAANIIQKRQLFPFDTRFFGSLNQMINHGHWKVCPNTMQTIVTVRTISVDHILKQSLTFLHFAQYW